MLSERLFIFFQFFDYFFKCLCEVGRLKKRSIAKNRQDVRSKSGNWVRTMRMQSETAICVRILIASRPWRRFRLNTMVTWPEVTCRLFQPTVTWLPSQEPLQLSGLSIRNQIIVATPALLHAAVNSLSEHS